MTRYDAPRKRQIWARHPDDIIVEQAVADGTLPTAHQKVHRYAARFSLTNREDDYRTTWAFFGDKSMETTS